MKTNSNEILLDPISNKGTAFTEKERTKMNLEGFLPYQIETEQQQIARCYHQFSAQPNPLAKNIYLQTLRDTNEALFFKLVASYLEEMLPIIYTPTIATAIEQYSQQFMRPRGIFIAYPNRHLIDKILAQVADPSIDLIVVTDGERILGIGDQGVGGINICVGKLACYTLGAQINPQKTLSIHLDAGTNNKTLLADPMYLGWRHERIAGPEYDEFVDQFIAAIKQKFPQVMLHCEDFGINNATRILQHYRTEMCLFNDDIQGTAVVTATCLLVACNKIKQKVAEQQIIILGAGSAGVGIADQIVTVMEKQGLTKQQAYNRIWFVGRHGLVFEDTEGVRPFQKNYLKKRSQVKTWQVNENNIDLLTAIKRIQPGVLIGCSTVGGAFTEEMITTMAAFTTHPIIFPLSNPTANAEAVPADLLAWTKGKALIATGSPFTPVEYKGKTFNITQCNNFYVFPGIGLGTTAVKATRVTDNMLYAALQTLAEITTTSEKKSDRLLPVLKDIQPISHQIAVAVANQAIKDGVAKKQDVEKQIANCKL